MKRKEQIIRKTLRVLAKEGFDQNQIECLIWYGSTKKDHLPDQDFDILAILKSDCNYQRRKESLLDLTFLGKSLAQEMAAHADPLIVDPLLTGQVIYQTNGQKREVKKWLTQRHSKNEVGSYLKNWSHFFYQQAKKAFTGRQYQEALHFLCLSVSYNRFANYYLSQQHRYPRPISFYCLQVTTSDSFMAYLLELKKRPAVTQQDVGKQLRKIKTLLTV